MGQPSVVVYGILENAVEIGSEVPAMKPRSGIYNPTLRIIVGGMESILGVVASAVTEELVVYFAGIGDVALGLSASDYTAPDYGRENFQAVH